MNKKRRFGQRVLASFRRVNLVDRYLMVIMLIMLLHCVFTLLFPRVHFMQRIAQIDIVVRSSLASIFGYFLSANFLQARPPGRSSSTGAYGKDTGSGAPPPGGPVNAIGFQTQQESPPLEMGRIQKEEKDPPRHRENLQVHVIAGVGLFSLLVLLVIRNFNLSHPEYENLSSNAETLRDLAAGSIGFLIGHVGGQKR